MAKCAPADSGGSRPSNAPAPTITAHTGYVVTGTGFLSNHPVTVRVTYTADQVSDDLAFSTDVGGQLYAEIPTSPTSGALRVTVTDYRPDPNGFGGLLWSNVAILPAACAYDRAH